ncbi:MAG: polysaccharide deacetylase family protein [Magnetococcus sp. YQC-9]
MGIGLMFHHFFDSHHPRGQGAISAAEFAALLEKVQQERTILDVQTWWERCLAGTLREEECCLTFDDALLCQYEIALPVLEEKGLNAYWFVYSSIFEGNLEPLEIYRHFRTVAFDSIDAFYRDFFRTVVAEQPASHAVLASRQALDYLAEFPFYTSNDRIFRYLRDKVLQEGAYDRVMQAMMRQHGYDPVVASRRLWMRPEQVAALHRAGHAIGLHSHTHPTRLADLPLERQREEYRRNRDYLTDLLGTAPVVMSHPCNSYSADTLTILGELKVVMGFRSNPLAVTGRTLLELARLDHTALMTS